MNRNTETGSPWRGPFSRLKYFVVKPPFSTHDFLLVQKYFDPINEIFSKSKFF